MTTQPKRRHQFAASALLLAAGVSSICTLADELVNDPRDERNVSARMQISTTMARNEDTGTICSAYNDSYSFVVEGTGIVGFSRSTNDGASFEDNGGIEMLADGNPSLVWRRADGFFYLASLSRDRTTNIEGTVVYRSTDDCQTMELVSERFSTIGPFNHIAVDNHVTSPHYGRLYLSLEIGSIYVTYSDDGQTWSDGVEISGDSPRPVAGWPTVGPDGTLYVSWSSLPLAPSSMSVEIARSTDGGDTFTRLAAPVSGVQRPDDDTAPCASRTALNGGINYLAPTQVVVSPNNHLHIVYSYDPDGLNNGDVVDVFYRHSADRGLTWQPEIRLSDDTTLTDQFYPSISAGPDGSVVAGWYDRRNDQANNFLVEYYYSLSLDGGLSFRPNVVASDTSAPIVLDPNFSPCFYGGYDEQFQEQGVVFLQWADARAIDGLSDSNVYFDKALLTDPDFSVASANANPAVCTPDAVIYDVLIGQGGEFAEPVSLSVENLPAGLAGSFAQNPVLPGDVTTFTIADTGALAPGAYAFNLRGTAAEQMRTFDLGMQIATQIPDAPILTTPANGSVDISIEPEFVWSSSDQTVEYTIEVALDAEFANVVFSETMNALSFASPAPLELDTTYYWRVTPANQCGTPTATVNSFTTQSVYCVSPNLPVPDDDPAGVADTINLTSIASIADLDVFLDISHTFIGNLIVTLTHEDTGTSTVLLDRPRFTPASLEGSCFRDDINATFDSQAADSVLGRCSSLDDASIQGSYRPIESLASFQGESFDGAWTLSVRDVVTNSSLDSALNEWCLLPSAADSPIDSDGDGVFDNFDNCTLAANTDQRDTDGDGFGNACDADLNNDCIVNVVDLGLLRAQFFTADPDADLNGDGVVNVVDLGLMRLGFFALPGPAVEPNLCTSSRRKPVEDNSRSFELRPNLGRAMSF